MEDNIEDRLTALYRRKEELSAKMRSLSLERDALDNEIGRLEISQYIQGDRVPLTKRNQRFRYTWAAVQRLLGNKLEVGMTTSEIFRRLTDNGEDLKYVTFRGYMHRFQKNGWLIKARSGKHWKLPPDEIEKIREARRQREIRLGDY